MVLSKTAYDLARKLRTHGKSIISIQRQVRVAKSTLSLWLRDIPLTTTQRDRLIRNKAAGLKFARKKASAWHRQQKLLRLAAASDYAAQIIRKIDVTHRPTLELALAMLYLGEGFKKVPQTGLGNADPVVLKVFVRIVQICYSISPEDLSCQLHLRSDQSALREKRYWSKELGIPINRFKFVNFDSRTKGSKTYKDYHGVCAVRVRDIAIQRKLVSIAKQFTEIVTRRA